jgi:hypothetical protein
MDRFIPTVCLQASVRRGYDAASALIRRCFDVRVAVPALWKGEAKVSESREARITIRLTSQARTAVDRIAALLGGVSAADAIRRAIGTELYLLEEQERGARILIEHRDTEITRELVLR